MRQIVQHLSNGITELVDAPAPTAPSGGLLIQSRISLISAGTERMLVDFGKASMIEKARQQPEKVRAVLAKVSTDGLLTTIEAVRSKLGQPIPLGYCNVGVVAAVGAGVHDFKVGDRVVSNGSHAELVRVPRNLCAHIPDDVSDEAAAFVVLAAIGLQGVRLVQPTLGECIVVTGVGLIGLAVVQLLRAHGCRVMAIDFDDDKLALARSFGAEICNPGKGEDPVTAGVRFSRGRGVDGVIITASTKSNDPVTQAAQMCRKRGRIVLVGVTGLELNRADFYEKELTFQVSCSYGPGRYDSAYEEKGHDYPLGFVRWTEQRNFEAVLDMLASRALTVDKLISHRFEFNNAPDAYNVLSEQKSALGILLQYAPATAETFNRTQSLHVAAMPTMKAAPVCGFIGAGNYASRMLIPAFKAAGARLQTIVTAGGVSGVIHGKANGFSAASTDVDALMGDSTVNTVAIVTRHNSHASFVAQALNAGKNVFVEKPLAITLEQLAQVEAAYSLARSASKAPVLMVGFNRRFSPHVQKMKSLLAGVKGQKAFIMTMNAGAIPADHWTQDPSIGGGRIIGEACHFIDLMRFLADSKITSYQCHCMAGSGLTIAEDKAVITLGFEDGSFGTIHYLANGTASFPKERIEVFADGRVLQLDNFRKMTGFNWPGFSKMNLWRQDKGQNQCVAAFLESVEKGKGSPISAEEVFEVARISIEIAEKMRA